MTGYATKTLAKLNGCLLDPAFRRARITFLHTAICPKSLPQDRLHC